MPHTRKVEITLEAPRDSAGVPQQLSIGEVLAFFKEVEDTTGEGNSGPSNLVYLRASISFNAETGMYRVDFNSY